MSVHDTYKTITQNYEGATFKDRGSKFIGYAFSVENEDQIKDYLASLKSQHHKARHWCYAWKLGKDVIRFRTNDDGEPSNSAGQPILGQLTAFNVTNILVVVVRYFGGVKLGVGGLINAYREGAKLVLQSASIIEKTIDVSFKLTFEYEHLNKVMRIIKENTLQIKNQQMNMNCEFNISVRKKNAEKIQFAFENLRCLKIKKED